MVPVWRGKPAPMPPGRYAGTPCWDLIAYSTFPTGDCELLYTAAQGRLPVPAGCEPEELAGILATEEP